MRAKPGYLLKSFSTFKKSGETRDVIYRMPLTKRTEMVTQLWEKTWQQSDKEKPCKNARDFDL